MNSITVTLYIDNMTCVNCENTIERKLQGVSGIEMVNASYSKGTVIITYDSNAIQLEQIQKIIEDLDYHVEKQEGKKTEGNNSKVDRVMNAISIIVILFSLYVFARHFGLLNIINSFPIAKEGMGYGMLFIIGLLTSVHCVAMCGGICLSQCTSNPEKLGETGSKFTAMKPSLLYNIGRIISYTVIGGIIGALGSVVSLSGVMKGSVQIFAGVFMVIMGLNMLNTFTWLRKLNPRMPKIFARKINAKKNSNSPLYVGLLNGLMPCGPLQAMQLYALSTGSPIKGAMSMFLFSVGTVPLMFAFGALSSYLSKKFTSKMMSVSAVLVIVLGIFMFNSGAVLSGLNLSLFPSTSSQNQTANVATIEDGVQTVVTELSSGSYEPIVVQKDVPVKWIINAEQGDINGCNNSIIVPAYDLEKDLEIGENVIEFTPTSSGTVPFSCWMGMIRSKITVVDDLNEVDSSVDSSTDSEEENSTDESDYVIDYQISTDQLAIAKISEEGKQTVAITFDENGFSPAVIVVQKDIETEWIINGNKVDSLANSTLIFALYNVQLNVVEGRNPVNFYPEQDFDFFTSDSSLYGYVKVVDDITSIDENAIKEEILAYRPTDSFSGGGGLPSCH